MALMRQTPGEDEAAEAFEQPSRTSLLVSAWNWRILLLSLRFQSLARLSMGTVAERVEESEIDEADESAASFG